MHFNLRISIASVLLACSVSCGGGGSDAPQTQPSPTPPPTPPPDLNKSLFSENDHWGDDIFYTSLDRDIENEAIKIQQSALGSICYLYRETDEEGSGLFLSTWLSTLECYDDENQLFIEIQRQGSGIVKDFVFLEDGTLVVAQLIKRDEDDSNESFNFELHLSHFSELGNLLSEKALIDEATDTELLYYELSSGEVQEPTLTPGLVADGRPQLTENALVRLQVHKGTLHMLAYTYGVKLYQLSNNLDTEWSVQAMPAHSFLWTNMLQNHAALAFSENDAALVAVEAYAEEAEVYARHFQRTLDKNDNSSDIIVASYSPAGSHQQTLLLGSETYSEQLVDISVDGNKIWLGASVRHNRDNPDISTNTEWDLLLAAYDIQSGDNLSYELIDIDKEDFAYGFYALDNGHFIFAGNNGFTQADTNSQTSDGNGMIVEVNDQGEVLQSASLKGPRNVLINSCQALGDGDILFAGIHNGPITHTCDADDSLCYRQGMVGVLNLAPNN